MRLPRLLFVFIATAFCLATVPSFAQETSEKERLAGELLDLLNMQRMFDAAFNTMPKMQEQMFASKHKSPQEQEKFHKLMQASMLNIKATLNWNSFKPVFVKIYADIFDVEELRGIISYYKSPTGQKWIEKQPQMQAAIVQAMARITPKIEAAVQKAVKDSDKADPSPASTPSPASSPTPS